MWYELAEDGISELEERPIEMIKISDKNEEKWTVSQRPGENHQVKQKGAPGAEKREKRTEKNNQRNNWWNLKLH